MKFSVLLPTRNRLDYLKYAVATVVKQTYPNWEIIISDNASTENIREYVEALNDSRIKYYRSETFLTVTENWNACIDKMTGDYVIMLGDDDIILNNYFEIAKNLIRNYHAPDLIYTNAYLYAYPGVLPDFPEGVFQPFGSLNSMPKNDLPFFLNFAERRDMVQKLIDFQPIFGTNMQHALIHKDLVHSVKKMNKFFYSAYPDFYAMCALFINAKKVLIYPKEIVVIGITPKSHGYYFFNKKEKEGLEFLNIQKELESIPSIRNIVLPAPGSMLTSWLGAMEMLKINFPLKKYNLKLDYNKYRAGQIKHVMLKYLSNNESHKKDLEQIMSYLSIFEKIVQIYPQLMRQKLRIWNLKLSNNARRCKKLLPRGIKKIGRKFLNFGIACTQQIKKTFANEKIKIEEPKYVCCFDTTAKKNIFQNALEVFEHVEAVDLSEQRTI